MCVPSFYCWTVLRATLRDPPVSISRQKSQSAKNWELQEKEHRTSNKHLEAQRNAMTTTTQHSTSPPHCMISRQICTVKQWRNHPRDSLALIKYIPENYIRRIESEEMPRSFPFQRMACTLFLPTWPHQVLSSSISTNTHSRTMAIAPLDRE